jgi:anti-anti-sigma factor
MSDGRCPSTVVCRNPSRSEPAKASHFEHPTSRRADTIPADLMRHRVESASQRTAVVKVSGEVCLSTAPQLREVATSLLNGTMTMVIVDLSDVTVLAVVGLKVLTEAWELADQTGMELYVDPGGSHAAGRLLQHVPIPFDQPGRCSTRFSSWATTFRLRRGGSGARPLRSHETRETHGYLRTGYSGHDQSTAERAANRHADPDPGRRRQRGDSVRTAFCPPSMGADVLRRRQDGRAGTGVHVMGPHTGTRSPHR